MKQITVILQVDEDVILGEVKDTGVTSLDEVISQELGWLLDSGMSVETWSYSAESSMMNTDIPSSTPASDTLKSVFVLNCVHETKFGATIYSSLHPTYEDALAHVEKQKVACDFDENDDREFF